MTRCQQMVADRYPRMPEAERDRIAFEILEKLLGTEPDPVAAGKVFATLDYAFLRSMMDDVAEVIG
jgi:hypothetical protein